MLFRWCCNRLSLQGQCTIASRCYSRSWPNALAQNEKATVLRVASNDADVWVRYHFCYAIPRLCWRVNPKIKAILARFLKDTSWHVRFAALEVVAELEIRDDPFRKAAVRALADRQWNVRSEAAHNRLMYVFVLLGDRRAD